MKVLLTVKPIGNRTLVMSRQRWKDIIRMDLKEIGVSARNGIDSDQDSDCWKGPKPTSCISHG
jgi:hypothetical protein